MREKAKGWMQAEKQNYLDECDGPAEAADYLIADCNSEAGTNLSDEELFDLASEVLASELEAELEDEDEDEDEDEND